MVWLKHLVLRLLESHKNLSKNFILQNILTLLIILYKLCYLVDFCNESSNKQLMGSLLQNMIIDEALFESSVKPLLNFFDNVLSNSILIIVKGAITFLLPQWIFAIPLVHLLEKQCKPFDVLRSIEWDHVGTSIHRCIYILQMYFCILNAYNMYFRYQWGDECLLPNKELLRYDCI